MKTIVAMIILLLAALTLYATELTVYQVSDVAVYRDSVNTAGDPAKQPATGDKYLNSSDGGTILLVYYYGDSAATVSVVAQKTSWWNSVFGTTTLDSISVVFTGSDHKQEGFIVAPPAAFNASGYAYLSVSGEVDSLRVMPIKVKK